MEWPVDYLYDTLAQNYFFGIWLELYGVLRERYFSIGENHSDIFFLSKNLPPTDYKLVAALFKVDLMIFKTLKLPMLRITTSPSIKKGLHYNTPIHITTTINIHVCLCNLNSLATCKLSGLIWKIKDWLIDWIILTSLFNACRSYRDRQKPANGTQCPTLTTDS